MFRFFSRKTNGTKDIMTSNANGNTSSNWNYLNKPGKFSHWIYRSTSQDYFPRISSATFAHCYVSSNAFMRLGIAHLGHVRCGAGAAGLCLAYKILEAQKKGVLGPVEFILFEKDDGRYLRRYAKA